MRSLDSVFGIAGTALNAQMVRMNTTASNLANATTVAGSANPANIRRWAEWIAQPIDQELLREVQAIFAPVKNIGHLEGLPENN